MTFSDIEQLLNTYRDYAFFLSILMNIFISIIGIIPSFFLTAINIKLFGITGGFIVSLVGELLGAFISFFLYRKGFRKTIQSKKINVTYLQKLLEVEGKRAFIALLLLRLLPFVPSSLITLFAALGKVSWIVFFFASLIGKLPALVLETYSVKEVLNFSLTGKVIIYLGIILLIIIVLKRRESTSKNN